MAAATRFPIKFEPAYALLSRSLFISPANSYVEIEDDRVSVRMAWAFRASVDRSAVQGTSVLGRRIPLTRGVHGWAGRWLVNGTGDASVFRVTRLAKGPWAMCSRGSSQYRDVWPQAERRRSRIAFLHEAPRRRRDHGRG
jgi:hypothetical protein